MLEWVFEQICSYCGHTRLTHNTNHNSILLPCHHYLLWASAVLSTWHLLTHGHLSTAVLGTCSSCACVVEDKVAVREVGSPAHTSVSSSNSILPVSFLPVTSP